MPYDPPPFDTIPSPYNFVPLPPSVFFPDWASQVSMDVPFSDGISGILEVEVTAQTPIYIRNGGEHPETPEAKRNDEVYQDFFKVTPDGPYAIPGTSLKGMLRSVIEIASFGKLRCADARYSVRDLNNRKLYTPWMSSQAGGGAYEPTVQAGWLFLHEGKWMLRPCEFARVELEHLINGQPKLSNLSQQQSSIEKYKLWANAGRSLQVAFDYVQEGGKTKEVHKHRVVNLKYRKAILVNAGAVKGQLVFTGQPSGWRGKPHHPGLKHMEFIFHTDSKTSVPLPEGLFKEFCFIHSEGGDISIPNPELKHWLEKSRQNGTKIPVFYLAYKGDPGPNQKGCRADAPNVRIRSLGLAMMYRLAYNNTVHQLLDAKKEGHLSSTMDLAETIFGTASEDAMDLRGRVSVGTFIAQDSPTTLPRVGAVLSSPKPTYYPNYIEQKSTNGKVQRFSTMMDKEARLRGWKRYPVRPLSPEMLTAPPSNNENQKIQTWFRPLPKGTRFTGKIRIHNLRPVELGALIYALTWGGDESRWHALGMARPFGFGGVTCRILEQESGTLSPDRRKECLRSFEECMDDHEPDWSSSDTIQQLLAMADPDLAKDAALTYPSLGMDSRSNEFVILKKGNLCLMPYAAGGQSVPQAAARQQNSAVPRVIPKPREKRPEDFKPGDHVECQCIVNKKGNRSFRIVGAEPKCRGKLIPGREFPTGLPDGAKIRLLVTLAESDKFEFDLPPQP